MKRPVTFYLEEGMSTFDVNTIGTEGQHSSSGEPTAGIRDAQDRKEIERNLNGKYKPTGSWGDMSSARPTTKAYRQGFDAIDWSKK